MMVFFASACVPNYRADAIEVVQNQAQIEMQCAGIQTAVTAEQGVAGGRIYQVGSQGCGASRSYQVFCPTGGGCQVQNSAATAPPPPPPTAPGVFSAQPAQ